MNEEILKKTYDFVKKYHGSDNSGHDFEHVKRVYQNSCTLLCEAEKCNEFVVKMCALLHDVDDRKLKTDGKNTLRFLSKLELEPEIIDKILVTIDAISFSKSGSNPQFKTEEAKILSDADKLDAIGAIGICRAVMFGTSHNTTLFDENVFPQKDLTKEEYKNLSRKENSTINHFFDKLLKLKNAMQTDIGRKEAQKRHNFMLDFLSHFFAEQNLDSWQNYLEEYLALQNQQCKK